MKGSLSKLLFLSLYFFLLVFNSANSQQASTAIISGKVVEEYTREPLQFE